VRKLVDTTIWVDFFRGRDKRLQQMLLRDEVAICPVIVQEILQGVVDDVHYETIKEQIDAIELIQADPLEAAIGAADLYRSLRKKGFVIRKANDCLIAWFAIHANYPLFHNDRDFEIIAKHTALKTIPEDRPFQGELIVYELLGRNTGVGAMALDRNQSIHRSSLSESASFNS